MKGLLYTDGGARGNPGPAGLGAILFDENGRFQSFDAAYGGRLTNNQAEYKALIIGLKMALNEQMHTLIVYMDSELIVKQMNGEYKVKDDKMKILKTEVEELIEEFEQVTFMHVVRSKNKHADKLVNLILDARAET